MEKTQKNTPTISAIAAAFLVILLSGCAQKPVLSQVDSGAKDKPINSPEDVERIYGRYSK